MKIRKNFLMLFIILLVKLTTVLAEYKRICYYTNWSQSRPTGAEFYPEDIDPELCSHIIYAFGKIENYDLAPTEPSDTGIDDGPGMFTRIMVLKTMKPSLKIMLAIGGWAQGSFAFDTVIESDESMQRFAHNAVKFLRKWDFDGLDVDWEFPVIKKFEFTRLLKVLRTAFDSESSNPDTRLLLSIAASAGQATIDTSYEIDKITKSVDFVNLMAYDFNGSWSTKTGYHSSLYSSDKDMSWETTLNADWAVNYWIFNGCPREKLVLGIAFYGRGFALKDQNINELGSPTKGSSKAGIYTKETGFLSYFEICDIIRKNNLIEHFDDQTKVVNVQYGAEWIGYENQESVAVKANYIKDNCLGGFMIWTVDFDDFKGTFCDRGSYPLLHVLNDILQNETCKNSFEITTEALSTDLSPAPTFVPPTDSNQPIFIEKNSTSATTTTTSSTNSTILTTQTQTTQNSSTSVTSSTTKNTTLTTTKLQTNITTKTTLLTTKTTPKTTKLTTKLSSLSVTTTKAHSHSHSSSDQNSTESSNKINDSNACGGNPFKADATNCRNFQVCIKGFFEPVATVKCPDSYWFDDNLQTCVVNKPANCLEINDDSNMNENSEYDEFGQYKCPEQSGIFPNKQDCNKFWHCSNGKPFLKSCPGNLLFNSDLKACSWTSPTCSLARKKPISNIALM